jgi:hypothetical protein|tara:strand:- start:1357 stop:1707 length:351 start_codon:yes stop_codon:yes gene_type:complete
MACSAGQLIMSTGDKWEKEKNAVKAVQVAFDLGHDISQQIRYEALEKSINPPDRIRQILGLPVNAKPVRPRLSISLTESDFLLLAEKFNVPESDRLKIRQLAAESLVSHLEKVRKG